MKVKVKVVEEMVYEIDLEPKAYLHARACLQTNDSLHELVLTKGKIVDCSRSWKSIDTEDFDELEKFFDKKPLTNPLDYAIL